MNQIATCGLVLAGVLGHQACSLQEVDRDADRVSESALRVERGAERVKNGAVLVRQGAGEVKVGVARAARAVTEVDALLMKAKIETERVRAQLPSADQANLELGHVGDNLRDGLQSAAEELRRATQAARNELADTPPTTP
jgi:hypothetical protein